MNRLKRNFKRLWLKERKYKKEIDNLKISRMINFLKIN